MSCVGIFCLNHLLTLILLCGGPINPCKLIVNTLKFMDGLKLGLSSISIHF
jgi:hypothetical protein